MSKRKVHNINDARRKDRRYEESYYDESSPPIQPNEERIHHTGKNDSTASEKKERNSSPFKRDQ